MSKKFIISCVIIISICISISLPNAEATMKVMWGKTESSNELFKMEKDNSLVKIRDLKAGEEFRVYSYKTNNEGLYGVGVGNFIQKSPNRGFERIFIRGTL